MSRILFPNVFVYDYVEFIFPLIVDLTNVIVVSSDAESSVDSQVPFLPSVGILVKALIVISSASVAVAPSSCSRLIFCSHHPCIVRSSKRDAVWRVILSLNSEVG